MGISINPLTVTDLLREQADEQQATREQGLVLLPLSGGVYSVVSETIKPLYEHYCDEQYIACNAQDEAGNLTDNPCALCTAGRLKDKYRPRLRYYVCALDVTSSDFGVLHWPVPANRIINKDGSKNAHQIMLSVLGSGIPTKPFLVNKSGKYNYKVEFPDLNEDAFNLAELTAKFNLDQWGKFNPRDVRLVVSNEELIQMFPEIEFCRALLK
ncbi:MAG: hypothetical protein HQL31_01330 [Planctomycetes bacterium]|nr:hypothetical protein [Planctomycetota bacterium]